MPKMPKLKKLCMTSSVLIAFLLTTMLTSVQATGVHIIEDVPWYQQDNAWMCGPGALQMIFDYYGPYIDQREIGFAAGTKSYHGTGAHGMVRAGHFSDLSTINEPGCKTTGYTNRGLGYAAFYTVSEIFWLEELKVLIDQDYPIIVATNFGYYNVEYYKIGNSENTPASALVGHYRVVVGYDDVNQEVLILDPWSRDYKQTLDFQGVTKPTPAYDEDFECLRFSYDYFQQLWSYNYTRPYRAVFVAPWSIETNAPASVRPDSKFSVTATVEYPCPEPFDNSLYPASDARITISLPDDFTLVSSETATKEVGTLGAGGTVQVRWKVMASEYAGEYSFSVEAEGTITGTTYTDRIGGSDLVSITVTN